MGDRGLICLPEDVPLLKSGAKTQTRRLMNPQPLKVHKYPRQSEERIFFFEDLRERWYGDRPEKFVLAQAPIQPGDPVYSKEPHYYRPSHYGAESVFFWPSGQEVSKGPLSGVIHHPLDHLGDGLDVIGLKKRSPMFQFKWAARWWGKCLSVRAEQLQEISFEDCLAEGFRGKYDDVVARNLADGIDRESAQAMAEFACELAFIDTWKRIHGEGAWEKNDWVFAYTLETE